MAQDHDNQIIHLPVLKEEVLDLLTPSPGESLLDLTFGTGGHSLLIGRHLGTDGLIAGMDADQEALKVGKKRLSEKLDCEFRVFQGRFSQAKEVLAQVGIKGFDLILADLGIGTHQLDNPARGFSFEADGVLDMRFDTEAGRSAAEIVNQTPEKELADIFYKLGQERFSRQIASAICRRRLEEPIKSPAELAQIAKEVYIPRTRGKRWRIHPATRIFMALRIYVNDELNELDKLLGILPELATENARAAIITYHSLEAKKVKNSWREKERNGVLELINKKPVMPSEQEISSNPRARSAQLRGVKFSG